jgi:hypothetical protein
MIPGFNDYEFEESNNKNFIVQENFILKDNFSFDVNKYSLENKEECSRYDNTPPSHIISDYKNKNENKYKEEFQEDSQSLFNQETYVKKKNPETFIKSNKSETYNYSTNSNSEKK